MPGISYLLGLDSSPAVAGLNAFKGALGVATGALALVGVGFGAFKGAEAFADQLKGVFEQGKELNTLHNITGQSIADVVALRKAFTEEGLTAESVSTNLGMLQKSLGGVNEEGVPTAGIFKQLGLNINELKGKSAVDQLDQVGAAIRGLGEQESKVAAARAVFGRSGVEMLALFANPAAIDEARESTAKYGAILQRDAGMFKQITNDLDALHNKVRGFFVGFADTISPVVLPILDKLKSSINLVGIGQSIGRSVATGIQTIYGLFKNGDVGEAAGLALRVGFANATNWLGEKLQQIFNAVGTDSPKLLEGLKQDFVAIKEMFLGLADVISGAITKGIAASLRDLKIGGIYVTDHTQLNKMNMAGNDLEDAGAARINKALGTFGTGGIAGQLGNFAKGLMTPTDEARARLSQLADAAAAAAKPMETFGPTLAELQGSAGGKLASFDKARIDPLSDRLSKIGGFVGGNGGILGERAQQDTARNTGVMVTAMNTLNKHMEQLHDELKPKGGSVF